MPWREGHDSLLPAIDDTPVETDCGAGYEHSRIVAHVHQNESRAFGVLALGYVRVTLQHDCSRIDPGSVAAWTFSAIDAQSKLVTSYLVGDRDGQSAIALMDDLRSRLEDRPQISTDGLRAYVEAIEGAFGGDVDFAQVIKEYGKLPGKDNERRYSPPVCTNIEKRRIEGNPDLRKANTSYVERSNLTMRMGNRRFTRLTNGFSKNLDKHAAMVNLFFLHYNFCRIHKTLGVTPAMEAGIIDTLRDMEWIVRLIDARASKPNRPKRYKTDRISAA